MARNTFCKAERLTGKTLIDALFTGGSKSFSVFPLRAVFLSAPKSIPEKVPAAGVLISVPKKKCRSAVMRNRVKRQIREAYRKNKQLFLGNLESKNVTLTVAFLYLDNKLSSSNLIETGVKSLLTHILEKTTNDAPDSVCRE